MKKWRQLSDREKFLNGVHSFCVGCAFYLVDCAIAPKEADHLFWMARGVYALGPVGFIITLPLLVGGVGLMGYYGAKLIFKKEPISEGSAAPQRAAGPRLNKPVSSED